MKRILALILLLALLLPLIPAAPVQAAEMDNSMRPQVRSIVSKVINDYGNSIYRDTAATEAIWDMGLHALFKNGAFLNVNEGDSLISSLFSANLFRTATIDCITDGILTMQKLRIPEMLASGGPHWHVYNDSFTYVGYASTEKDYDYRLNTFSSCSQVYGSKTWSGSLNRNDYAMQLLIGGLSSKTIIRQTENKNGTAVYTVRMIIGDNFDFDSSYSSADKAGWDASIDKALIKLGRLLDMFVIDTFDWEFVKEFQIEVPFPCDHELGAYSWELEPETMTMHSLTDGFQVNRATTQTTVSSSSGKTLYYYRLDKPLQLNHDKPWVVEYEANKLSGFSLAPTYGGSACLPILRQYSRYYIWSQEYDYFPLVIDENNSVTKSTYTYHYWAAKMRDQYKYYSKHTYTYRIENVPGSNGSNMIYVSVYDNDLGEQVLAPTPMNDYMTQSKGEKTRTLHSEEDNRISGQDFIINYIGNKSYYINTGSLKLTIWENGENSSSCDNVTTVYKAPTCTEDGGLFHTCRECGYGYVTKAEKALGHSYGSYTSDGNASCEKDGTKTADCTRCGYKNTVTDTGTATGHNVIHQSAVDATCDTPGLTAGSYCDRCYTIYEEQQTIPAPGHSWQEATCDTPRTCSTCGLTEGEAAGHKEVTVPGTPATCIAPGITDGVVCGSCGLVLTEQQEIPLAEDAHSWQEATCLVPQTCSLCGVTEGEALGHTPEILAQVEPTCLESGLTEGLICSACGTITMEQELIPALGHHWLEATCLSPMTCSRCGALEGEAHAHNEVPIPALEPDCENSGLTEGIACSDCGAVILPQTAVSALGHDWQEATCESAKTCSRCDATEGEALGHSEMVLTGTAATCTEPGLTEGFMCTVCEAILVPQQEIPALLHQWADATCTQPQICTLCSATQGEVLPHDIVTDAGRAATCTKDGLTEGSHCGTCGVILDQQKEIPATGHEWQPATCTSPDLCTRCGSVSGVAKGHDPVVDPKADATCTEAGLTEGSHCADCSTVLTEQQEIPALGHSWKAATCTKPKTCTRCNATEGKELGHDPEKGAKKEATCTTDGHTGVTRCKTCDSVLDLAKTVPATGHKDRNGDNTCDSCGAKLGTNAPATTTQPTEAATKPTEAEPVLTTPPTQEETAPATGSTTEATQSAETTPETGVQEERSGGIFLFIALLALAGIGCCLVLLKKYNKK